jgi:hypothetical protein
VPEPEDRNMSVVVRRRRRTRRHRRNRLIRRWFAGAVLAVFAASVSTLALMYFSPAWFHAGQPARPRFEQSELSRNGMGTLNQVLPQGQSSRPVYPYSVVPGGVEDAKELKWAAEHDPVVAAHYAGFDYDHAQVVRLTLARTVYVSYRIGSRIYWTRRRIKLHKGEKLITDGRMTARSRCANRVAETPQQAASPAEPPAEKFDQPGRGGDGTAMQSPPVVFQSTLLNRPEMPGPGPAGPPVLYNPIVGGTWVPISLPPLPVGVCVPVKKKGAPEADFGGDVTTKKKVGPCGTGGSPGTVPEPGTWVMLASGLAAICEMARRKLSRA